MDLFTTISIIILALIILTPILGLATATVARRHYANIINRLMEENAEQEHLIFALKTNYKADVELIDERTVALNKANKLIDETIEDLRQSKSAYNLLVISIQGKDARITELNELLRQRDKKIEELLFQLDKLENQS